MHKGSQKKRGYIAMIVVLKEYRGLRIGKYYYFFYKKNIYINYFRTT